MIYSIDKYKKAQRRIFAARRDAIPEDIRRSHEGKMFAAVTGSAEYASCRMLLTYVSIKSEADTRMLMKRALADGKHLAVPKCGRAGEMTFYEIHGFDDLEMGKFSLIEPKTDICRRTDDFVNALCIVPGLAFDRKGSRLGYGGGYYDRFLHDNPGIVTFGLCYGECLTERLICGRYDLPVDAVITEKSKILSE